MFDDEFFAEVAADIVHAVEEPDQRHDDKDEFHQILQLREEEGGHRSENLEEWKDELEHAPLMGADSLLSLEQSAASLEHVFDGSRTSSAASIIEPLSPSSSTCSLSEQIHKTESSPGKPASNSFTSLMSSIWSRSTENNLRPPKCSPTKSSHAARSTTSSRSTADTSSLSSSNSLSNNEQGQKCTPHPNPPTLASDPQPFSVPDSLVFPDPAEADALLAQEFTQLSMNQREQAMQELHGVETSNPDENPELVSQGLARFDVELNRLVLANDSPTNMAETLDSGDGSSDSLSAAAIYQKVLAENPSYVQSPAFRLLFLRAKGFDNPLEAAQGLLSFFAGEISLVWPSFSL